MEVLSKGLHRLHHYSQTRAYHKFQGAAKNIQETQLKKLQTYLKGSAEYKYGLSYADFATHVPVTNYSYWKNSIDQKRVENKSMRFEPTSGSTDQIKWIPYSREFSRELGVAASVWLHDLGIHQKGFLNGKHYWSLSWIPTELRREINSTNDIKLFSFWKRQFFSQVMAVPEEISLLPTSESSFFATLCYLVACRDLTVISVWSPTFALELFRGMVKSRGEIIETLTHGKWQRSDMGALMAPRSMSAAMVLKNRNGKLSPEFFASLWPKLSLISSWDSSTSSIWAQELKKLFPHVDFQPKGLWATEAVVTIPLQSIPTLAVTSHFYEFRDLETKEIIPSWELKKNQRVQPIITAGNGLWRYELQDQLEVTGFYHQAPQMKFLGRIGSVDMVGEKLDKVAVSEILADLSKNFKVNCLTLMAVLKSADNRPRYVLLAEGEPDSNEGLERALEQRLTTFHHYKLARELSQLNQAAVIVKPDALQYYEQMAKIKIQGNRKLESITVLDKEVAGV